MFDSSTDAPFADLPRANTGRAGVTPARFAPMPLLSGEHVTLGEEPARIAVVAVVVTDEQGNQHATALERRHGGWWVPQEALALP